VAKPIVGYLYRGNPTDKQLQHMTHVAHSFAVPTNGQGGLSVNRESVLASLVPRAHAQDCKVGISIFGGLGSNTPAYNNALNSVVNHRAALVNSIMGIVDRYGLDWVDLDLEPIGEAADAFVLLLRDLRARLGSRELSAAVLAGVPLYERPGSRDYKALVAIDRVNSQRDSTTINGTEVGYNGQPTVRWKMDKWGGVAFWEVYGDTQDDTSLLLAAYEAARPQQPDPWWGWFPERQAS
jgi:hypothetical protein